MSNYRGVSEPDWYPTDRGNFAQSKWRQGVDDALGNTAMSGIEPTAVRDLADLVQTALDNENIDRQYIAEHVLWVLDKLTLQVAPRGQHALDDEGNLR